MFFVEIRTRIKSLTGGLNVDDQWQVVGGNPCMFCVEHLNIYLTYAGFHKDVIYAGNGMVSE